MTWGDRIFINGLRVFGHHGVQDKERRDGQFFVVDIECALDLAPAGRSDDLDDTVDYESLAKEVRQLVSTAQFSLLEALAQAIADLALQRSRVGRVRVKVTKPDAPVEAELNGLGVEIVRVR